MKNRKICIFTQTYGNDRDILFHYHNMDSMDIYFRNSFDLNIYSFHNSSDSYVDTILCSDYISSIKKIEIIRYNQISYTQSWKNTINYLIENNIDYVVFLQDECFSIGDKNLIDGVINFIKEGDYDMLNLEYPYDDLNTQDKEILNLTRDITIFKTNSIDFVNRGYYYIDDGPYVSNLNFLTSDVYDDNYYQFGYIWSAENYLNEKIKNSPIDRFTMNKPIYKRFNIVGRNRHNKLKYENDLKEIKKNNKI